jgi:hypothetical protein
MQRLRNPEAGYAVLTVVASGVLAVLVLRLWHASLGIPLTPGGDNYFTLMQIKGVLDNGWVLTNPYLGAPFGQDLHDFAGNRELLQVVIVKVLGLFSSNPAAVYNVYYLLSFPMIGLASYVVMRWLGISRPAAAAMSALYAVAPFHFRHGTFLWAYYTVPLAAYLILAIYSGAPLFERRPGPVRWPLRYASRRSLLTLGVAVAVALSSFYYAGFTVLLVLMATAITFVVSRRRATLAAGAAIVIAIFAAGAIAETPALIYHARHGGNAVASERGAGETEFFSTNIVQLVMPVAGHRVGPLRRLTERWQRDTRVNAEATHLGLIAALGFVWLVALAVVAAAGATGKLVRDARQRHLSVATLTALLLGTTGGISGLIAYTVTAQLRTWTRLTIFIAFFALAGIALLLDAGYAELRRRGVRMPRVAVAGILGLLCGLAALDQTSQLNVPSYAMNAAAYRGDDAFAKAIEAELGDGGMVYQLPYVPFPEGDDVGGTGPYDEVRPYLHSTTLRYSFGAMKGRPADWQADTAGAPPEKLAPAIAAAGFDGVYIDRFAYADFAASTEAELQQVAGTPPLVSADKRFSFFSLRLYAQRLRDRLTPDQLRALGHATVKPVRSEWGEGFSARRQEGPDASRWAVTPDASLTVTNPSERPRSTDLFVELSRPGGEASAVALAYPDGTTQRVDVPPEGVDVERTLSLPRGASTIRITTVGSAISGIEDASSGYVRLVGWRLTPTIP